MMVFVVNSLNRAVDDARHLGLDRPQQEDGDERENDEGELDDPDVPK